jgi:hypothetical protein
VQRSSGLDELLPRFRKLWAGLPSKNVVDFGVGLQESFRRLEGKGGRSRLKEVRQVAGRVEDAVEEEAEERGVLLLGEGDIGVGCCRGSW